MDVWMNIWVELSIEQSDSPTDFLSRVEWVWEPDYYRVHLHEANKSREMQKQALLIAEQCTSDLETEVPWKKTP